MNVKRSNRTICKIVMVMIMITVLVLSNVLFTMVTGKHFRSGKSVLEHKEKSTSNYITLHGSRGSIYDRNGEVIAEDEETYTVAAIFNKDYKDSEGNPDYVQDIQKTAKLLAPKLKMKEKELLDILAKGQKSGNWQIELGSKAKGLSASKKESIEALNLPGITFTSSIERSYPTSVFASHLIGYAQHENDDDNTPVGKMAKVFKNHFFIDDGSNSLVGQMGLEKTMDPIIRGKNGFEIYQKDINGNMIPGTKTTERYAEDGDDVYLTLDHNVQLALQSSLTKTMKKTHARRGWGIVMEVETGKILGYAGMPSFDLNKRNIKEYIDIPSSYLYEPGSVMKGITYSAAIDSGNYPYDEKYRSGIFYYGADKDGKIYRSNHKVGGFPAIRDALNIDHGTITFDEGFIVSSNIAICELLTNHLDPNIYKDYVQNKFLFTKPVNIPYVDNASGSMQFEHPTEKLNTGFGQGISITALQMVQAYSAILNDGVMVQPYVVDRIVDANTKSTIKQYTPTVVGQPISKKTANYVTDLMRQVVEDEQGTGHRRFKMDDVSVVAKTGTGQIATEHGYGEIYTNSVMAAAPADDPKIMVYYVFESSDISSDDGEPFKETMKAALVAANITGEDASTSSDNKQSNHWKEYKMPSLMNHSVSYAKKKLKDVNVDTTIIGNGGSVVAQYPAANDTVVTNQHIFLLTDGNQMTMPNMTQWTKKDITAFWQLTKIEVIMKGNGAVISQNIPEGKNINKDTVIKVKMK